MKRTENLNLPIYDNPESDIFKINDVNNAHETIDKQYKELKNIKETIESTNPSANLQGQINDINASLENITFPTICFTYDDQLTDDSLTNAIYNEYNFKCGYGIIVNDIHNSARNNIINYFEYEKNGHEILSHAMNTTPASSYSHAGQRRYEIQESANILRKLGFNIRGWITPSSALPEVCLPLVREVYNYGFTIYTGYLPEDKKGHNFKTDDRYKLTRISLKVNSEEDLKIAIDNCIQENGLLIFYDHGMQCGETKLRNILDYVKTYVDNNKCIVSTPSEAVTRFFGVNKTYNIEYNIDNNLIPSLKTLSGQSFGNKWWVSNNDLITNVTTYKNGDVLEVQMPSVLSVGEARSISTIMDISEVDLSLIENNQISIGFDLYGENPFAITCQIRTRFLDSFNSSPYYDELIEDILYTTESQNYKYHRLFKNNAYKYVMISFIFRAKTNEAIDKKIYIKFPSAMIGNVSKRIEPIDNLSDVWGISLNFYNSTITKNNNELLKSDVNNNILQGLVDGSGTFKIKNKGRYYIRVDGLLTTTSASNGSGYIFLVRNKDKDNINSVTTIRGNFYIAANGSTNVLLDYILDLEKGEIINIMIRTPNVEGNLSLSNMYMCIHHLN